MYYLWNVERRMWWKPSKFGYTNRVEEAGVFKEAEAIQITANANSHGSIEDLLIPVHAVETLRLEYLQMT